MTRNEDQAGKPVFTEDEWCRRWLEFKGRAAFVQIECDLCQTLFLLDSTVYKLRVRQSKSGKLYCSKACSGNGTKKHCSKHEAKETQEPKIDYWKYIGRRTRHRSIEHGG